MFQNLDLYLLTTFGQILNSYELSPITDVMTQYRETSQSFEVPTY